jgi:hypothetical protein
MGGGGAEVRGLTGRPAPAPRFIGARKLFAGDGYSLRPRMRRFCPVFCLAPVRFSLSPRRRRLDEPQISRTRHNTWCNILGAMNFRLNDYHLDKPKGSRLRGKRTRAKELVLPLAVVDGCPPFPIQASQANGILPARTRVREEIDLKHRVLRRRSLVAGALRSARRSPTAPQRKGGTKRGPNGLKTLGARN